MTMLFEDVINKSTKADQYLKLTLANILAFGVKDHNPRPHWKDGMPAYSLQSTHHIESYDLFDGESPFITLRPTSYKAAIGEILWIYQDQSNDLDLLRDKYGVTWWDEWDVGNRTIGASYGETVRRHNLINELLEGLEKDPDGRRHIMSLWQVEDFKDPHGLKPCCFQTMFNIVHHEDGDRLDMCLVQRSADYIIAGNINTLQYVALQYMVAGHLGIVPGKFTKFINNVHIYDRHIHQAKELIGRNPVEFDSPKDLPRFEVPKKNFFDYTVDDIKVVNYPMEKVKQQNSQMKFELAI